MKKILLLILALSFFWACKTPAKLVDATTTSAQDNSQLNIEKRHATQEAMATTVTTTIGENSTTVEEGNTVVYDTDKPVDPGTGKHPVKSETTTRKTTEAGKQVQAQTQSAASTTVNSEVIDKTKKNVEVATTTTHEEASKTPRIAYAFYIVLIVAIIVGVYFLNRKFKWLNKLLR